jgi:hypothetical protein
MNDCYTWEELIELGCPPGLVMQYINWTKSEINKMLNNHAILEMLRAMDND